MNGELAYNEKYVKTKIKSYKWKINTNFHNDKILKEDSHCVCLSVILIDSVLKMSKNYYPQAFVEEYKYIVKEKEVTGHITEDLETYSDEGNCDEENSDKENFIENVILKEQFWKYLFRRSNLY